MRELIDRARRGDREAFATLVDASIDRSYAIAIRVVGDRDRAEDAVQSTFLRAWKGISSLRDPDRFDAWLYRLLLRACYEEVRGHRAYEVSVRAIPVHAAERTHRATNPFACDGVGQRIRVR